MPPVSYCRSYNYNIYVGTLHEIILVCLPYRFSLPVRRIYTLNLIPLGNSAAFLCCDLASPAGCVFSSFAGYVWFRKLEFDCFVILVLVFASSLVLFLVFLFFSLCCVFWFSWF